MESTRVLLIDQDRFLSDICRKQLEEAGFDVTHMLHGEDGLAHATKQHPDVILLEIALPNKDGFTVLEELKGDERTQDIPVMMYSDLGSKEDVERCFDLGACDYLIKAHHTPEDVVTRVKKVMGEEESDILETL